jgi:SAM-dependent methyltransferase
MMQDVSAIAPALTRGADGAWHPSTTSAVDYPDQANAFCFAVEDSSFWFRHRNAVIVDIVRRFPPSGFIADVGAGNGYVSLGLQQAGFDTLVVEPGPAGIRNAHTRGLAPLVRSTLQDAGFLPGSLPAAGLFDVLEHIEDDMAALRLLHTLIAPLGRLYLSVPAFRLLWSSEDDLAGHHRRYTTGSLSRRLRETGFDPEYATYFFAPLPLPILLLRALPSRLGFRRGIEADRIAAELKPKENVAVRATAAVLAAERALIRRGWRLHLGSSCLVVARRL